MSIEKKKKKKEKKRQVEFADVEVEKRPTEGVKLTVEEWLSEGGCSADSGVSDRGRKTEAAFDNLTCPHFPLLLVTPDGCCGILTQISLRKKKGKPASRVGRTDGRLVTTAKEGGCGQMKERQGVSLLDLSTDRRSRLPPFSSTLDHSSLLILRISRPRRHPRGFAYFKLRFYQHLSKQLFASPLIRHATYPLVIGAHPHLSKTGRQLRRFSTALGSHTL